MITQKQNVEPRTESADQKQRRVAQEAQSIKRMQKKLGRENPNCQCKALGFSCIKTLSGPTASLLSYEMKPNCTILSVIPRVDDTLFSILRVMVWPGVKMVVILLPKRAMAQFEFDYQRFSQHFIVPSLVIGDKGFIHSGRPVLHAVPTHGHNGKLSEMLAQMKPDVVMAEPIA